MNATCYDPQYDEGVSTCSPKQTARPWYRRWYFGLCRDGELWIGLGPIAVAVQRN